MKLLDEYSKFQDLYNKGFRFDPEEETFFTSKISKFKHPEGYENWKVQQIDKYAYRNQRLKELGIDIEKQLPQVSVLDDRGSKYPAMIFGANDHGDLEILQYTLHRKEVLYERSTTSAGTRWGYCVQKRLNPLYADFCEGKYDFSEAKNVPFWHPDLIQAFENEDEVPTLTITEGQIKAFKACMEGIPTIGLTSISHFRDKKTKSIHPEIIEFIRVCKVKQVVVLWDGDCKNISNKALAKMEDLAKRPTLFYSFASKITEGLGEFIPIGKSFKVFFATIRTEELAGAPKGIDDLLIEHKGTKKQIAKDFAQIGKIPSHYIDWINIGTDQGRKKMRRYFNLHSVQAFYGAHSGKIKGKEFVFQGSNYRVENGIPIIEIPKDLKSYMRIGTEYYQTQMKPVAKNGISASMDRMYEETLVPWTLSAIKADHGKDADKHVVRYKGFTNEANHIDYQQVIDGYWNLYSNINHEVIKGDFPHIKHLLKHLFQEHYDNEMILDYFSVLYRYPWQKLPVICLVSKEQASGKSTFIYLMKLIFKQNMQIISNSDLTSEFNSHWVSKLVVASEETLLEKKDGYEKIKSLTTAKEILRNEKNKTADSIPIMVHFVFCSNHENDFIKIDDYDSRLWIRKVGTITKKFKDFDRKLEEEIPYFIDFILNREIKYENTGERLFFAPNDFRTEAFRNVVAHSEPGVIKDLRIQFEEYFLRFNVPTLELCVRDLKQYFGVRGDDYYLNRIIKDYFLVVKSQKPLTYSFLHDTGAGTDSDNNVIRIKGTGRFFTFHKEQFVKQ